CLHGEVHQHRTVGPRHRRTERRRLLRCLGAVPRPRSHDRSSSMSTHVRSQEEIAARVKALESILIEKGIMTTAAVDRLVEIYENEVGPQPGDEGGARARALRQRRRDT